MGSARNSNREIAIPQRNSPSLSLHQCGLPREIAIELFQTFVIRGLIRQHVASNIGIVKKVMEGHPVLLNRAPTFRRLGIETFEPILVEGRAICSHPLVRKGFNADFDGDQMAVHVHLSLEAQVETCLLMFSHMNLLSSGIGDHISVPIQDMRIGLYVLTIGNRKVFVQILDDNNYQYTKEKEPYFCSSYDAEVPIEVQYESLGIYHEIHEHYRTVKSVKKEIVCRYIRTTVGHISFYREMEEAIQGFCRTY
ncbi:hypothetical protein AMTRI_Chr07g77440 [Amborella trichopoda]